MIKNVLSACIGVCFIAAPWIFGFSGLQNATVVCVALGAIQFLCSLLAIGKSGKKAWQNWAALITGFCFIVFPNVYHLEILGFFLFIVAGFLTLLLNYSSLYDDYQ